jgi:hypothetical protein
MIHQLIASHFVRPKARQSLRAGRSRSIKAGQRSKKVYKKGGEGKGREEEGGGKRGEGRRALCIRRCELHFFVKGVDFAKNIGGLSELLLAARTWQNELARSSVQQTRLLALSNPKKSLGWGRSPPCAPHWEAAAAPPAAAALLIAGSRSTSKQLYQRFLGLAYTAGLLVKNRSDV